MASQYSSYRSNESNLSRTIFRLAILFVVAFCIFQGYPYIRDFWAEWAPGTPKQSALEKAEKLLASGDATAAATLLDEGIAAEQDSGARYAMLRKRIEIARQEENWSREGELLKQTLSEYSSNPDYPLLVAAYGRALYKQERLQEARSQFEEVLKVAPKGMHAQALLGLGQISERDGELVEARDRFRAAMADSEINSEDWNEALEQMGRLNTDLIFDPQETPESKYYTVEPGDTLTSIGIKLNTTQGLLTRANNIDDVSTLHPGQRLKYTPKDFRVIVERSTCRIFLMDNQGPFKCYPTGLGMPGYETTLGKYTIGSKQKDPTWFQPNGPPVPPNDPANELGTRWMPMVPVEEGLPTDLGIHGTIAPETIGHYKSHGCPRMHNASAEELYDLIVRSTPVAVVEVVDWSEFDNSGSLPSES